MTAANTKALRLDRRACSQWEATRDQCNLSLEMHKHVDLDQSIRCFSFHAFSIRSAATANEGEKASSAPPPVFDKSGQWVDYYIHDDFSWLSVFGSKYPCNTFCFVSQFPSLAGRACIPAWPQAPVARVHLVGFLVRFVQPSPFPRFTLHARTNQALCNIAIPGATRTTCLAHPYCQPCLPPPLHHQPRV